MSIEDAIAVGEKFKAEQAAAKEAARIASMTDEQRAAESSKQAAEAAAAKAAAEEATLLTAKDEDLDDEGRKKKEIVLENTRKREAEEAQKAEEELLSKPEASLSADELTRRKDLIHKRNEAREAEKQAKIQSRIDEIVGELKAEREERRKDKAKIEALDAELKQLRGGNSEEVLEQRAAQRIQKYIAEDANKPKHQRREMSDEDLQEWIVEDMVAAQRWLAKQEYRREREAEQDRLEVSGKLPDSAKAQADEVIRQQAISRAKAEAKHPELNIKNRVSELRAQGKSDADIQSIIFKENPKARIASEILKEGHEKYITAPNGPEMLAEEVERRLAKSSNTESQEDRDERIAREAAERERQRIASVDASLNSTRGKGQEVKMTDEEKAQFAVFQKAMPGKSLEDFRKAQDRRKKYANA